jgi:HD-like signal output (HDOD) protein
MPPGQEKGDTGKTVGVEGLPEATGQSPERRDQVILFLTHVAEKCDLPTLPKVAERAIQLTRQPDARTQEVARVIGSDASLAAQVLKISRSAAYLGRREAPRTLQEAITTVGFQTLRRILVVAGVRSAYVIGDTVAERLWEHALATAIAADELGQVAGQPRGGDGFIAGLLHDIGKLVLHLANATAFASLPPFDGASEISAFGVTHTEVGSYLLNNWGLEPPVVRAVGNHHVRPVPAGLAMTVVTADWIAHKIGFGSVREEIGALEPVDETVDLLAVADRVADVFEKERALFD